MSFRDRLKEAYEEGKEKGKKAGSFEYQAQKLENKRTAKRLEKQEQKERIKQMDREGTAYCPKCKGTSIQYVERRKNLSVGRGIVGSVVAGPLWGAVGATTSKKYKGFVKCMKCGHKWKI